MGGFAARRTGRSRLQSDQEELKCVKNAINWKVLVASIGPGGIEILQQAGSLHVLRMLQSDQEELKYFKDITEVDARRGFNRTRRN